MGVKKPARGGLIDKRQGAPKRPRFQRRELVIAVLSGWSTLSRTRLNSPFRERFEVYASRKAFATKARIATRSGVEMLMFMGVEPRPVPKSISVTSLHR